MLWSTSKRAGPTCIHMMACLSPKDSWLVSVSNHRDCFTHNLASQNRHRIVPRKMHCGSRESLSLYLPRYSSNRDRETEHADQKLVFTQSMPCQLRMIEAPCSFMQHPPPRVQSLRNPQQKGISMELLLLLQGKRKYFVVTKDIFPLGFCDHSSFPLCFFN